MDLERVTRIIDAEAAQHDAIEARTVAQVRAGYTDLDWYDHTAIGQAAAQVGEVVRAASNVTTATADAFLTRAAGEVIGRPQRPAGAVRVVVPLRRGVSGWAGVYGRVADTVRFELSKGADLDTAVEAGLRRAETMTRVDLALARREQWRRTLTANPQVVGWRRVIHPELSRTGVCGLCIAAADRIYSRDTLAPLHAKCKCTVLMVTRSHDPGGTLNNEELAAVYASARSTSAADLKRVRYTVHDHGELGPVLADADHHFRGPADVAA